MYASKETTGTASVGSKLTNSMTMTRGVSQSISHLVGKVEPAFSLDGLGRDVPETRRVRGVVHPGNHKQDGGNLQVRFFFTGGGEAG